MRKVILKSASTCCIGNVAQSALVNIRNLPSGEIRGKDTLPPFCEGLYIVSIFSPRVPLAELKGTRIRAYFIFSKYDCIISRCCSFIPR